MNKFLRGTKASLITLSHNVNDPAVRKPAVGVFTSLSDENAPMRMKSTKNSVSAFMIDDITPASPKEFDGRVKVFFHAPSREDKKKIVRYNFVIPVQYLATSITLSAMDEPLGGLPLAFFDSAKVKSNEKVTFDMQSVEFFLVFPMKESQEYNDLSDKLEGLVDNSYATALAPIPWDMVMSPGREETSPTLNTAQGLMFNHLIALARGDIGALMDIMAMEKYIDSVHGDFDGDFDDEMDDEYDDDLDDMLDDTDPLDDSFSDEDEEGSVSALEEQVEAAKHAVYPICLSIVSTMLDRIRGYNPRIKGIVIQGPEVIGSAEYEPQVDLAFDDLTSSLNDIFKGENFGDDSPEDIRRKNEIEYWDATVEESCPEMKPLFDYIDALPDKEIYRELLTVDFTDAEKVGDMITKHGLAKCFTAMSIIVASYAVKKGTMLSRYVREIVPPAEIISSWIGVSDTNFVWELPSLAHSLSRYNTANAVEVLSMHYKPRNDIENAVYLWNSIYYISEMFDNNEFWSKMPKDEFKARLDKIEDRTPEFVKFKAWFISFFNVIKNDDHNATPEKQNETHEAIHEFFGSEEDITVLATYVAKAFIALADIIVMEQELTADDDEWNARRMVALNHLLTETAEHAGSRVDLAIR